MKIAVLSGKGGVGKTFVASNLAAALPCSVYVDCDVEEPNGKLFFKPENVTKQQVYTTLPDFNIELCDGCRKCVDFCQFNALIFVKNKPMVFSEVCHACGGCMMVCPKHAIIEKKRPVGMLEIGEHHHVKTITGILNIGEASAVPVIGAALEKAEEANAPVIIDCPPGSSCSVMESISDADYCILVTEPTSFGFHNVQMVYELTTLLNKPCGMIINKYTDAYEPLENFCQQQRLPILARIPYQPELAQKIAAGELMSEGNTEFQTLFQSLYQQIGGDAK